jgi:flavodoxin
MRSYTNDNVRITTTKKSLAYQMIKRHVTIFLLLIFFGCSSQPGETEPKTNSVSADKILIVYLSRTNNTKALAEIIHKQIGGTLVPLELQNPYPEDYKEIVEQVAKENETGFLPPLRTKIDNIHQYDYVFLGFPTWGMQLPPPMKSFLSQYDLTGKTIVPFNTNGGYGIGSTFETVKKLSPKSKILEGFSTKGGVERDGILFVMEGEKKKQVEEEITNWLKTINLVNEVEK